MIDEYADMKSIHDFDEQVILTHQRAEYITEKERMSGAEHALKVMEIQGTCLKSITINR
jgi:hypothetical protein